MALAGALGGQGSRASEMAGEWLDGLRQVRLTITGDDLLAAGVASGPELGRRLEAALARKLDGELQTGRAGGAGRGAGGVGMSHPASVAGTVEATLELPGAGRALFTDRSAGNLSTGTGDEHEQGLVRRAELCERLGLAWLCSSRQGTARTVNAIERWRARRGRRWRSTRTVTRRRCGAWERW